MIKQVFFILFGLLLLSSVMAQDRIVTKDGKTYKGEILSMDSLKINFIYDADQGSVSTSIEKNLVLYIKFKGKIIYIQTDSTPHRLTQEVIFADSVERVNNNFIYTYSGDVIRGNNLEYKTPFLGASKFIFDSREIRPDMVKFYKNDEGFFANTRDFSFSGSSDYTERIKKGKINLYKTETRSYMPGNYNPTYGMYGGGFSMRIDKYYYNKGFGDLKKANYYNLMEDLADCPESMLHLDKIQSIRTAQTILGIVGSGLIIIGFATLINKTKDWDGSSNHPEPNVTGSIVTLAVGSGCVWTCALLMYAKPKHIRNAIGAYNR